MTAFNKNYPSSQSIAEIRKRFEVEREVDRALTYKLRQRSGPAYSRVPLEALVDGLRQLIADNIDGPFQIRNPGWLAGGASKLQVGFELEWNPSGTKKENTRMVLRSDVAESLHATSRAREFQMVNAVRDLIPVPEAYWYDDKAQYLPYPSIVYEFVDGVTKPSSGASGVSGLGTYMPKAIRDKLAPQFTRHLAKLHTFDFHRAELPAFDIPKPGPQNSRWAVNWWDRVWYEDAEEEIPLVALASSWLHQNAPSVEHLSVVHGDYRTGNFLFSESSGQITTWLDWELCRIGDRHQDLAWSTSQAFTTQAEDGKTQLVSGLMPKQAFLDAYEQASGLNVDKKSLHYYQVFNAYSMVVMTLGTSYRVAKNGKSHQDILLAWLMGVGYMLLDEIRELIEQGA